MKKYLATYIDPVDLQITHYREFNAEDSLDAKKQAKQSVLQRKDNLEDILFKLEELTP
jgi:hypothetical protein